MVCACACARACGCVVSASVSVGVRVGLAFFKTNCRIGIKELKNYSTRGRSIVLFRSLTCMHNL